MRTKILIIEDSTLVSRILGEEYLSLGYECNFAFTLAQAKEHLSTSTFDLISLDLHLPDGEGETLLDDINMSCSSDTKVVVYSGDKKALSRKKLQKNDILDYFHKDGTIASTVHEINALYLRYKKNDSCTILIIDDSKTIQLSLSFALEGRNYNVITAATGKEGLLALKNNPIDLVLLDLVLPDMHGTKVLEKIKSHSSNAFLPVLILSGSEPSEVLSSVYKLGAADFLHKPFVYEELLLKVDFWIDYNRNTREVQRNQKLLQEYKDAVDRSNIVSKANLKGVITYVNEAFCDISGYSEQELIERRHNVVRHPDTSEEIFEDLWNTISAKRAWSGIITNRAKDGSSYTVNSSISPIIDDHGTITEYIAVRTDITDLETIKKRLIDELHATAENFEEAMELSKQYETAINESNILTRTAKRGKIIYANEAFCQISGYSKEELIGSTHKLIRHPDSPSSQFKTLWETIKSGAIWKDLIMNRTKAGTTYWVDSVIIPITDHRVISSNIWRYVITLPSC